MEVKSRDIGSTISSPSKRKSKKKIEAATSAAQAPPAEGVHTKTAEAAVSPLATFKIVFGVALVSIVIGIILGKRY